MTTAFRFSGTSEARLRDVHPDLQKVVRRALELSTVDFSVAEGVRSYARQKQLFDEGKSRTMRSRHLTGHAVDLYPVSKAGAEWHRDDFRDLADAMKRAAKALGIPVEWGGDWTSFQDCPHWQLPALAYPW